jgi:hypothetical protein
MDGFEFVLLKFFCFALATAQLDQTARVFLVVKPYLVAVAVKACDFQFTSMLWTISKV